MALIEGLSLLLVAASFHGHEESELDFGYLECPRTCPLTAEVFRGFMLHLSINVKLSES